MSQHFLVSLLQSNILFSAIKYNSYALVSTPSDTPDAFMFYSKLIFHVVQDCSVRAQERINMQPALSVMRYYSCQYSCLRPILIISVETVFQFWRKQRYPTKSSRKEFSFLKRGKRNRRLNDRCFWSFRILIANSVFLGHIKWKNDGRQLMAQADIGSRWAINEIVQHL